MSGHSHWSRIKHKKGVTDARRGRLWSKLARNVIMAAKRGADPRDNLQLRYAVDKAKQANMPKDTIENAIKKGAGGGAEANFETVYYEGYGAGGVAILAEALTDNRNRTAPEIKKIFERTNGNTASAGCVQWMFSSKGQIAVLASTVEEDQIAEIALTVGADDYARVSDAWEISCDPGVFEPLREALAKAGITPASAELTMVPSSTVKVEGDNARRVLALIEALEDHDDIQNVYANFEIADDVMDAVTGGG